MLLLEGTPLDRLFTTQAVCADEATRSILQKGGFVYLTYNGSSHFSTPVASLADGTGTNELKKKAIYPVLITRIAPGAPRTDFNPINETGLITIIMDHAFEAYVTADSYLEGTPIPMGTTYATISAGDALKIYYEYNADPAASDTANRPKLIAETNGVTIAATTVALALTPTIGSGTEAKIRILWL